MKRAGVLLAALALASCAFGSETPLFRANEAAFPIRDGGYYEWLPHPDDDSMVVRFVRAGAAYEARQVGEPDQSPMRILFTPVIETRDDDYIAQVDLNGEGRGVAYAFLWPIGDDRYRVVYEPRAFDMEGENAAPELCAPAQYGGCTFASAQDVRAYFLRVLYPALSSGQTPERYLDIEPIDAPTPPRKPSPR